MSRSKEKKPQGEAKMFGDFASVAGFKMKMRDYFFKWD